MSPAKGLELLPLSVSSVGEYNSSFRLSALANRSRQGRLSFYVEAKRRRTTLHATDHSVAAACATRYTYPEGGSFYGIHSARYGRTGAHRQVGIHQGRALGQRRSLC